jgi:hypothetical protein
MVKVSKAKSLCLISGWCSVVALHWPFNCRHLSIGYGFLVGVVPHVSFSLQRLKLPTHFHLILRQTMRICHSSFSCFFKGNLLFELSDVVEESVFLLL